MTVSATEEVTVLTTEVRVLVPVEVEVELEVLTLGLLEVEELEFWAKTALNMARANKKTAMNFMVVLCVVRREMCCCVVGRELSSCL